MKSMTTCVFGIGAAAVAAVMFTSAAQADKITFMTGPAGGTWFPLGGAVKQILEQEIDDLSVTIRPGAGLINIKGISAGKTQIAWGNVISTVDALAGRAPFNEPMPDLCNIAAFYFQSVQIPVTDMAIESIGDLRGRSFATLPRGNTTEAAARAVLDLYDLTYDDLGKINFASVTDQVNMMKDGQIEAFLLVSSVPAGGVLDLATARRTRLLPIPDDKFATLKAANPGWSRTAIPAGTYSGQDEPVPTASFQMHMMANCSSVSDDLAYAITKAIATRGGELSAVTRMLDGYTVNDMAADVGVPFHPGAARYYKDAGVM